MWGNKKSEAEAPPPSAPVPSKAPEINPNKPVPAPVEGYKNVH